eukprot:3209771-Rhodomonas_salina.1
MILQNSTILVACLETEGAPGLLLVVLDLPEPAYTSCIKANQTSTTRHAFATRVGPQRVTFQTSKDHTASYAPTNVYQARQGTFCMEF